MALGLTQLLTEISTRNISLEVRAAGSWQPVTILPFSHADCHEIGEPQPPGTLGACTGTALPCLIGNYFSLFRKRRVYSLEIYSQYFVLCTLSCKVCGSYNGKCWIMTPHTLLHVGSLHIM
jgi:hypothetical protein